MLCLFSVSHSIDMDEDQPECGTNNHMGKFEHELMTPTGSNMEPQTLRLDPGDHTDETEMTASVKRRKMTPHSDDESDNEDSDKQMLCCICSEDWVKKGAHRLVSLKCGHLFGER